MPEVTDGSAAAAIAREGGLVRALTSRQLTMIGLGGALGTGLFMGSGIAIGYAGPGVMLSYLIAAAIALAVMYSLSEMAVAHPTAGSFGTYADLYLNRWSGFIVRYTYWSAQVIAVGGEALAIGQYLKFWFPGLPVWTSALGAGASILFLNSRPVSNFGTTEYWLSMIKVTAIVAFILFGVAAILGIGVAPVGFHNYTIDGGPLPHGFHGVWMAVMMSIFSFVGIEIIAVTSGEAADPDVSVPRAMKQMLLRLLLFYFLALGVILAAVPWSHTGAMVVTQSPFVRVFSTFGLPAAASIINFVIISAAFSSMNANVYLCTRMLFSLARAGKAPAAFGRVGAKGTLPLSASVSTAGVLVAALVAYLSPKAYNYLLGIALFGGILTWIIILATHLQFRRKYEASKLAKLSVRAPFFPIPQLLAFAVLIAVLVTMGFDREYWDVAIIVGVPWIVLLSGIYLLLKKRSRAPEVNPS